MPLYDYRCSICDKVFQVERPFGYLDREECPACGEEAGRIFQIFETPPKIGGGACDSGAYADTETVGFIEG